MDAREQFYEQKMAELTLRIANCEMAEERCRKHGDVKNAHEYYKQGLRLKRELNNAKAYYMPIEVLAESEGVGFNA